MSRAFVGLFSVLSLAACTAAPVYGPMGGAKNAAHGYREVASKQGTYTLLVVVPAISSPSLADEFWNRRAGELCGGANYKKNIFRAERPTVLYDYYGGKPGDFMLEGYLTCAASPAQEGVPMMSEF